MSNIYISKINIQDFRTFGQFEINLPAAPGLVLLTGTNGLGKSSFFDAIEWGLTGKIRRFTPYVEKGKKILEADYLTRRGAIPNSHQVTLTFSDGAPIYRNSLDETPMASIIAQLTHSERPAIEDLDTYLALTHFLGQAAQQRFTSREPEEQWKALKGPSGIDRLEQVRSGLRGRPTVNAFNRRIEKEESALKDIAKKIAEWQGWGARLNRLRQASRATGNLTLDEVAQRIVALEVEVSTLLHDNAPLIIGETTSLKLTRLGDRIKSALQAFTEREATIMTLSETIDQYMNASANAVADHPVLVRARQVASDAKTALYSSMPRVEQVEAAVTAQSTANATLEQNISILEAVRSDLTRRGELVTQIDLTKSELLSLSASIVERRIALSAAETAVRAYTDELARHASLRSLAQRAVALVDAHANLVELEIGVNLDADLLAVAMEKSSVAKLDLEPLRQRSEVLKENVKQAHESHRAAEQHASAISGAVAMLASHIHNDDTDCPVCQTSFEPGLLKILADEAAVSGDARLAGTAAEIERLRTEFSALNARMSELQILVDAPLEFEKIWRTNLNVFNTAKAALARELDVDVTEDLGVLAKSREEDSSRLLAESQTKLELVAANGASGAEQRVSITAELEDLLAREALATSRLNVLNSENQACGERITARGLIGSSMEELNASLLELRTSLETARSQMAQLIDEATTVKAQVNNFRDALTLAERGLTEAEAARTNAEATTAQLIQRWNRGGLQGTPSQASLDRSLGDLRESVAAIRLVNDRVHSLANDNQDVLLLNEINEVVEALRNEGGEEGLKDPEAHLAELRSKEIAADAALKLTKSARTVITQFTEQLKKRAEDYSTRVLSPLNSVIGDFNNAMLSTPGESIQFKADHRVDTTNFGMSLRYQEPVEAAIETQKDLPPQIVLSEGQLAANGFSILCAASTAYPWSRWRALLLDDPLQHNDIIHTAAFIDVMRNMVELQGYQLIMSSHDRSESDFIARKFNAAGLACTRIELTAPSEKGVVYEAPEHNQVAKRIIQSMSSDKQIMA